MQFLDMTLPTLEANLALDEALLLQAETVGLSVLRFWEWPKLAVVLGAGCKLAEDVNESACRAAGVLIARRSSGGGTVMLGPGCLVYSLVLPFEGHAALGDVNASYRYILTEVAAALAGIAPGLVHAGTSDLARAGRKVSGNAQHRKRTHLLHHGTLLYDFELGAIARYLNAPGRQPDYRAGRAHLEFVMNLDVAVMDLQQALRWHWHADQALSSWPQAAVAELARVKYGSEEWVRRR